MSGSAPIFALFAAMLLAVAVFHRRALTCALVGLAAITAARVVGDPAFALGHHLHAEWGKLLNLFGLLVGFPLLGDHVERSGLPRALPRVLPRGTAGCFTLLALVWLLSGVLDNIAAATIGATLARDLFDKKVHVGYLAAVVAAANAGGAGSVLGDTTTTMMWIAGVRAIEILPAYLGAAAALAVFGLCAARQQHRHQPLVRSDGGDGDVRIDGTRLAVVGAALAAMVAINLLQSAGPAHLEQWPLLALALWLALLAGSIARPASWRLIPGAARSATFLVALVLSASLLPVQSLPPPSTGATLALGLTSAVFDNIPLTRLALGQGGHDWALLSYAVGFGGSLLWFGSSAGVAVAGSFPEIKSVARWLRAGWHIGLAYFVGFAVIWAFRLACR